MPYRLILPLLLTASPLVAEPPALHFPVPATQTGQEVRAPVRYDIAIGAFDGTQVPMRAVQGALDLRAYRLDGITGNTLALTLPLQAQLEQAGYGVVFECDTTDCGGFDFRFAIDLLPEPQMHVDLGDFHYVAAVNAAGDAVALLVSRAADLGFVQVASVSRGGAVAAVPQITAEVAPLAPVLTETAKVEVAQTPAPGPLGDTLLTAGSVALDDLVFSSGKAVLQDQDYASLTALAEWLKAHPGLIVTLVGHTDASGSLAGNVALSKQRASAVRDALVQKYGAPAAQMEAQGAGYLSPRASNQTPEGRQKNRRVEVMLTSTPVK